MSFAFISYNHKDRDIASKIVAFLEGNSFRCFIDYRDLPKNSSWDDGIPPAIKNCEVVIFLVSENFMASEQVKKEVRLAINQYKKTSVVFRLDSTPYPENSLAYHLSTQNCIKAFENPENYFADILAEVSKSIVLGGTKCEDFVANSAQYTRLEKYIGNDFEVVIPQSFKSIGFGAFHNSSAVKVVLPETVTEIAERAFRSAGNLMSVQMPKSIKKIGKNAFLGTKLDFEGELIIGSAYIRADKSSEKISLPSDILCIADGAFESCASLTKLSLNSQLKYIGAGAFRGCTGLKSLILHDAVEYIGRNAFFDSGIKNITLYSKVPPKLDGEIFDYGVSVDIKSNLQDYKNDPVWSKYLQN